MKKRLLILLCTVFCCAALSGCMENALKYAGGDDADYFTPEYVSGGDSAQDVSLKTVSLIRWFGPEKIVFEFTKDGKALKELSKYDMRFNDEKTYFELVIYGCKDNAVNQSATDSSKFIKSFEIDSYGDTAKFIRRKT